MKKKSIIIILSIAIIFILTISIILLFKNKELKEKTDIQIIDATFSCVEAPEKFYEDKKYIYSFPCIQSKSVYVKFENGNKMLVVDALNQEKVTIDELIEAGLKVRKNTK